VNSRPYPNEELALVGVRSVSAYPTSACESSPDQRNRPAAKAQTHDQYILGSGQHHGVEQQLHRLAAQPSERLADDQLIHVLGGQLGVVKQAAEALDFALLFGPRNNRAALQTPLSSAQDMRLGSYS
jgi:hypothetical protein